jgi:hypothetical protein
LQNFKEQDAYLSAIALATADVSHQSGQNPAFGLYPLVFSSSRGTSQASRKNCFAPPVMDAVCD